MAILYFNEGIRFKLPHPRITTSWIKASIKSERKKLSSLSIIFCSDSYLLKLNSQYLNHRSLTDILTFDYSEGQKAIQGEIYISVNRVIENAKIFKRPFDEEIRRVIVHGVLHLIGYNDKTTSEKALMREKEEAYLSLW